MKFQFSAINDSDVRSFKQLMKIVQVFAENSVFEQEGWMQESSDRPLTSFKRRLQRRFLSR